MATPESPPDSPPEPPPGGTPATAAQARVQWQQRLQHFDRIALPLQGRRHAAVAVGLTEEGLGDGAPGLASHRQWSTAPALLLTRRAAGLSQHAGQWAFPGGRLDAGETPVQAALRELAEETALHVGADSVLGVLDDYPTRSGYVITPVVMWLGPATEGMPQPGEVASLHRIPTAELLRDDAPILNHVKGQPHPVLRMPIGTNWIAAPTAAVLYQLREVLLLDRLTRVAHFDQPHFAWS